MVIKNGRVNKAHKSLPKKNKIEVTSDRQIVVVINAEDAFCSAQKKANAKKKKHLVKGSGSAQMNTKKKKKKKGTESKNTYPPISTDYDSGSESLQEILESPKIKKERQQGFSCVGNSRVSSKGLPKKQEESGFPIGKICKRNISNSHGDEAFTTKKKKKIKSKPSCSLVVLSSGDDIDDSEKCLAHERKTMSQKTTFMDKKHRQTVVQNAARSRDIVQKDNISCCLASMGNQEHRHGIPPKGFANSACQRQEKSCCKARALGCKQHQESATRIPNEGGGSIKKWKKERKKKRKKPKVGKNDCLLKSAENHADVSNENVPKSKSKKKTICFEEKVGLIQISEGDRPLKKKKKKQAKVDSGYYPSLREDNEILSINKTMARTKKRAKTSMEVQDVGDPTESSKVQNVGKKRKQKCSEDSQEEPCLKKAMIKNEAKEGEDEIKVVAVKKGNCDEINIDKLRRQELQEEIDRESGKTKAIKLEEDEEDIDFGQWRNATFERVERQTKFLRLLGGFKTSPASAPKSQVKPTRFNMALDQREEENRQRNLQAEFEKAMELKQHRGIGLGFQPAAQKQVSVDKYASKSFKFQD